LNIREKMKVFIKNQTRKALFVPMRRYGQLKNTHVAISTLRFLNGPCLALKQTELFQNNNVGFVI